jgi:hypothetical protein
VASGNADRSVYQLAAKDRDDSHGQQVFRLTQVGADEDLKITILAVLTIPTLAYASVALTA